MSTQSKGIALILAGLLGLLGSAASLGFGVLQIFSFFQPIATFQAPGSTSLTIEQRGEFTLWHDFQTVFEGSLVTRPERLSDEFTFELIGPAQGLTLMTPASNSRMSGGSTSRIAVGSFANLEPGAYELRVGGPEERILSVTEGGALDGLRSMFGGVGLGMLCGLVGSSLIIAGTIVFFGGKSKKAGPPELRSE